MCTRWMSDVGFRWVKLLPIGAGERGRQTIMNNFFSGRLNDPDVVFLFEGYMGNSF